MDTIIGLGSAGCNIAEQFKKYPQYKVYQIDAGITGENCFCLKEQICAEDYERNFSGLGTFLHGIDDSVLFITSGGGTVSGAALQILKEIKNCEINVLYIKPSSSDLSEHGYLQERLVRNVFQEYARSGLFKTLYLVSNENLEEIIGDIPILEHYTKLNDYLVSMIHWINVFKNTDPVLDNFSEPKETARIATFGVLTLGDSEERSLYDLDNVTDRCYYYAINENVLKTDGKLLKNIREQVTSSGLRASYEIHSTKYQNSFCYFVSYTNVIQALDK